MPIPFTSEDIMLNTNNNITANIDNKGLFVNITSKIYNITKSNMLTINVFIVNIFNSINNLNTHTIIQQIKNNKLFNEINFKSGLTIFKSKYDDNINEKKYIIYFIIEFSIKLQNFIKFSLLHIILK